MKRIISAICCLTLCCLPTLQKHLDGAKALSKKPVK